MEERLIVVLDNAEELEGNVDALTWMSKDVIKFEALRLRLVLLIYKYAKLQDPCKYPAHPVSMMSLLMS